MIYKNTLLILFSSIFLVACSDKPPAEVIAGLNLPDNVEVIQDDDAVAANLAAANFAAYDSAGTDYTNAKAETWIDAGNWQQPLGTVDTLICIIKNTGAHLLPNSTYSALVDNSRCADDQGGAQKGNKATFLNVPVVSTRSDNTSVQNITAYFNPKFDYNNDGVVDSDVQYLTETVITDGASTSNPFGVFSFNWSQTNAAAGDFDRGSLAITDDSTTQVALNFYMEFKGSDSWGPFDKVKWVSGKMNKDGSGGKVKVSDTNNLTSASTVYKVNFNTTHANIDSSGAVVCNNLDEATMSTYVYSYNLYDNTTGALKDLTAGLAFVYGDSKDKRGYTGEYTNSDGDRKWWMWTEDRTVPSTIYKESDTTISYTTSGTYSAPVVTGLTLDDPINFAASFTDSDGTSRTDALNYEGPGQLWGINWTKSGSSWSPQYNIADGTSLTDTLGTVYKVKQMGMWKTLATAVGACDALPVTDAEIAYTAPTLTATIGSWASMPTITAKPRIIQGVLQ